MAMQRPEDYRQMSADARTRMYDYAGSASVEPKMMEVLEAMEKSVPKEVATTKSRSHEDTKHHEDVN